MHYRGFPHSLGSNSEQQLKPAARNKNTARSSRVLNGSENFGDGDEDDNNNDDADYEEDEDDDPDDADFEPDYGITSERTLKKEELEEEDSDCIEKVLWHQPKGVAEEALRSKRSTDPVLLSYLFDSEPNWNEMEFLIKWKGQSHLHCQWKSFSELQNLSGFKKVLNYTKKVTDEVRFRKTVTREEVIFLFFFLFLL
ncbi:protein CHROMATIN REMODELING 5-like isoform X2 [Humulus lupulus]|uniref:protein CHROMATIN REMODELING 5-like isoform X2 n=1 Tax=Humulus lupulus TaxID=3486 RepID=UPI002B413AC4|nr:protein CHROMATIN REMODELING 5-like isoform X2 [Humulus lupulus]